MNRKKALVLGLGAALAATGLVGSALAQSAPPPLPSTVYGDVLVPGAEVGDLVYAIVDGPNGSEVCGFGEILDDPERPADDDLVYVIDVKAAEPQDDPLCGTNGRTIRFYLAEQHGFAAETRPWQTGVRPKTDLSTISQDLDEVAFGANSSYSGIQQ